MLVSTGAAVFRFLVVRRLREVDLALWLEVSVRAAALGLRASLVVVLAALARLPLQVAELRDPDMPAGPQARALLFHTMWGHVWWVQIAAALLAALGFALARKDRSAGWLLAGVGTLGLVCCPAFSGHAIGSERLPDLAVLTDCLHVMGACAWLGAMFSLFAGVVIARRHQSAQLASALVASFSPLALVAASLVGVTGVVSAWLHLGALAPLWQSRYGRTVLIKLTAVAAMAALGFHNWRRAGPALHVSGEIEPVKRSIRAELVMGALVLLATAVLVVTPPPGSE